MWILLRLIAMAIGFVVRHLTWSRKREDNDRIHGIAYSEVTSRHKGTVTRFELSVPLDTGLVFVFTPEGGMDRLYKKIGLTEEFQTGDDAFDRSVYVGSDHPVLLDILDAAPPVVVEARVEETWTTASRRRRGGSRTHYHARLTSRGEIALPSPMKIPAGIYSSLVPGRAIEVEVGTGRLGFPYFRSVNGIEW